MWLTEPDDKIQNVLWEAKFQLENPNKNGERSWGQKWTDEEFSSNLPFATIGEPESYNLSKLLSRNGPSEIFQDQFNQHDFYLIRFLCSFRPVHKMVQITWARFVINLMPDFNGLYPTVFDMYPLLITNEVEQTTNISLTPNLKFSQVELGIGDLDFGIKYSKQQPIVSASGIGEKSPSWDYESTGGPIQGTKIMYMLLRKSIEMKSVRVMMELFADVKIQNKKFGLILTHDKDELFRRLSYKLI